MQHVDPLSYFYPPSRSIHQKKVEKWRESHCVFGEGKHRIESRQIAVQV
jgi:hypothetical protein